jgi:hypothetical protein
MPSVSGAFRDIAALSSDRGEGEVLRVGTPAKAVVKGFALPSTTEPFAMTIHIEVHVPGQAPYVVNHTYPTARQKAPMTPGMEVPVKVHPHDPSRLAVQWDALKGSIAASGGDMAAVMGGLDATYGGVADAAMRQAMATGGPAVPAEDPAARLSKLGQLRDAGAITEDEFAAKKAEILREL